MQQKQIGTIRAISPAVDAVMQYLTQQQEQFAMQVAWLCVHRQANERNQRWGESVSDGFEFENVIT